MNDIPGFMLIEDYVSRILYCKSRVVILQKRLETCEKGTEKQLKERIQYYKRTILDDKRAIRTMFNSSAMSRSFTDFVPDDYYIALIDRDGCVKGVIL